MFDAKTIKASQARMESRRATEVDGDCAEIAGMILPDQAQFSGTPYFASSVDTSLQYDEYGAQALEDGVSVFEGFTMPRGQKWQGFGLPPGNETIMDRVVNAQWFEKIEGRLFALRNDPESGFTTNVHQSATSLLTFWGQSMWVDKRYDERGRFAGLSYQSEHVGGIWVERDAAGIPYRIHRKIVLTAEQATDKWKDKAPAKVREAMTGQNKRPAAEFEFLHVIERNMTMQPGRLDAAGKPWAACYYSCADCAVFDEGAYRTLRRIVSCYDRAGLRTYGRSPNMKIIGAHRAAQVMMQDRVMGTELTVKPPLLAPDDDLDQAILALKPWGITYGGLDEMKRERLKPFLQNIDLSDAKDLHGEIRLVIDKANFRDLLQLNREMKTHISATRTMEEIAEKGVLLSPLARQEQEWFAPMLAAELDLMWEVGLLDDMPPDIQNFFARGGGIHVTYDNMLNRMMEASEAAGYLRTAEQVAEIAQFDNSVVPQFTREYPLDKVIPGLGRANGIPARWRSTDEEKAAIDQRDAAQAQVAQLLQAAPVIAQTAKDAAAAGAPRGA